MAEYCSHTDRKNGICTVCGLCMEENLVEPDNIQIHTRKKNEHGWIIERMHQRYLTTVSKLSTLLNLEGDRRAVTNLLSTVVFKDKISDHDKALLCFYHLLQDEGFPISLRDLLKYTRISKSRFLKIYRNTFGYRERPTGYYIAIYERCVAMFGNNNLMSLEHYLNCVRENPTSDPKELCIACMINLSNGALRTRDLRNTDSRERDRIQKVIAKLRLKRGESTPVSEQR